jgi:hypothetical protein
MQLRSTQVKGKGKTYRYAQLVESYRRESDGMPSHRVIANLGALSSLEFENLRVAIRATRDHKRVVLSRAPKTSLLAIPKISANLRYLDAAVLLELWKEWGLTELLDELLPLGDAKVAFAKVIASLAVQRCVDPGSKLYATRWFPKSALPELLDVSPGAFNNTRLHRALDDLDAVCPTLMAKLPRLYRERNGAFVSLFLDVTDAWFVGRGPPLAEFGKTKEGLFQQKIGIVLLCNEDGYPLRWEVIPGSSADCTVMTSMLQSIAGLSWVGEAPVVCDRAMGHTAQIWQMAQTRLRFLTALTVGEIGSYTEQLPHQALAALSPSSATDLKQQREQDVKRAAEAAQAAGMKKVADNLLVLDLGIVERTLVADDCPSTSPTGDFAQGAMRLARQIHEGVVNARYPSYAAAGQALGLKPSVTKKYGRLRTLAEDLQRELLDGKAAGCSLGQLLAIAKIREPDEQREAFAALVRSLPPKPAASPSAIPPREKEPESNEPPKLKVRLIAYFNPDQFVEQRLHAQRDLEDIQTFTAQLNASLASGRSRRTYESVAAAVDSTLRKLSLLEAFKSQILQQTPAGRPYLKVDLELDPDEWAKRRRYDGFTVLAAAPSLTQAPEELCRLYRAKDVVEKDFQVIKSIVELRPIRHRTNGKVRAHVAICMLALLLERTLAHKLKGKHTVEAALELLEDCHLNRFAPNSEGPAAYILTELTSQQNAILRTLGLQRLGDTTEAAERITPR